MIKKEKIDWKFRDDAEPMLMTDNFWYMLVEGGYLKPEVYLSDQDQRDQVANAISILCSFENALEDNGLIEEC